MLAGLVACQARANTVPALGSGPLGSAEAYLERGDGYAAAQAYSQAIADYSEALRQRPNWAEAYNNRGYSEWWHGQSEAALADYNQALALRPAYAYAYNNRGVVSMATGQTAQSIVDVTRALKLQPDFPQAYRIRGNAFLRLGQFGPALSDFRRAGGGPAPWLLALGGVLAGLALLAALIAVRWRWTRVPRAG